jgi:hypothetical protein
MRQQPHVVINSYRGGVSQFSLEPLDHKAANFRVYWTPTGLPLRLFYHGSGLNLTIFLLQNRTGMDGE